MRGNLRLPCGGYEVLDLAEIDLTDDLGLAVHALAVAGVVVGMAVDLFGGEAWHIYVIPHLNKQINSEMFRGCEGALTCVYSSIYRVRNLPPRWGIGPERGVSAARISRSYNNCVQGRWLRHADFAPKLLTVKGITDEGSVAAAHARKSKAHNL